jgi:hypothetical protein
MVVRPCSLRIFVSALIEGEKITEMMRRMKR